MEEMYYYLMLTADAKRSNMTPEEHNYFNKFLRGNVNLAD